ncbi:MAG: ABC transporter ATP-binding protein [Actinomycetota bacterium]
MTAAINVEGLTKSYGSVEAVRGVDLRVDEGEIVAFLGHNGAGKTTTVEILEGFRTRSSGAVDVLGVDPARAGATWRQRLGIVLQESEPMPELTAGETLALYAGYYEHSLPVDEVLSMVGLAESAGQRAGKLSGGQKRRLDLGLALIGDPELIFLDEPTTGFDPSARREAWEMIANLRSLGRTVLLTTHYMDEAEYLADRIIVIDGGLIVANGTADDLRRQVGLLPTISWATDGADLPDGLDPSVADGRATITTDDLVDRLHRLTSWAMEHGVELDDLRVRQPSLEDVYLSLTTHDEATPSSAETEGIRR